MKKLLLLSFFSLLFLTLCPTLTLARDANGWDEQECIDAGNVWYSDTCIAPPPKIELQMPFGSLAASGQLDIRDYLKNLYTFGVGAAGILAVIMIILGGFIWLTAGGNAERVTTAKNYIQGALIGLVIALGSYTLLRIINPSLVYIVPLRVPVVKQAYLGNSCPIEIPEGQVAFQYTNNVLGTSKMEPGDLLECGNKYALATEGSEASTDCNGLYCVEPLACLPTGAVDSNNNVKVECASAEDACIALDENVVANLGMGENQNVCDKVNESLGAYRKGELDSHNFGTCVWVNLAAWDMNMWGSVLALFGDDGCRWCSQTDYIITSTKLKESGYSQASLCSGLSADSTALTHAGVGFTPTGLACLHAWCTGTTGSIAP